MGDLEIQVSERMQTSLMAKATKEGRFLEADELFDQVIAGDSTPDVYCWTAKINNQCKSGRPDDALQMIDTLKRIGIAPNAIMFNAVLRRYFKERRSEDLYNVWIRMHEEAVDLTRE